LKKSGGEESSNENGIIRRGFLEHKEKKVEISLLGSLNNERNKKNKRRIKVVKERSEGRNMRVKELYYTSLVKKKGRESLRKAKDQN
jgi:3'-phosphoadenosine 5'-phosphosulfate sulfotransferase